jgi:CheY-specific phosphatase CheX
MSQDLTLNHANLFKKAVTNVFKEYGIEITQIADPKASANKYISTKGLDVLIYLFEELEGIIVLSMDTESAINIAKSIDMDPDGVDEAITREIIAEVGNLSAARVSGMFAKKDIKTNITPPSIFCGKDSQIFCPVPDLMEFSISGQFGQVYGYSAIRQKEKKIIYV